MHLSDLKYGFIGFGHMGEMIFSSLEKAHLLQKKNTLFTRKDPKKKAETEKRLGVTGAKLPHLLEKSDIIFLCMRPQDIARFFEEIPDVDLKGKLFISIVSGITLTKLTENLKRADVVRAMPNAPSSIAEGMTTLSASKKVDPIHLERAKMLFAALGKTVVLPESLIDAATGLAGSSPALIYLLVHSMISLAKSEGISEEDASLLATQTFIGAAKLIQKGRKIDQLLTEISVPGGTTIAAIDVMRQEKVERHFQKAIKASITRAKELSGDAG